MTGLIKITSFLQCPHGGVVQILTANTRVSVDGAFAALATDQFLIAGCPFQIPIGVGMKPSPCVTVRWVVFDTRTTVSGSPTLNRNSVGLCFTVEQIPQGPVSIVSV